MAASIKATLAYLKDLKNKYASTEALRGKSFAVAKLIKHLKSKPVQTKDGQPLEAITCAADALRVQGCGPLFARMIEAHLSANGDLGQRESSSQQGRSSAGSSKRSRTPQTAQHLDDSASTASPKKRPRPRANEDNTSVLRFAKAGTAACALLVGLLRLAQARVREASWESTEVPQLVDFEFTKEQVVSEATPLTETQFGNKAPVSAAYASYSDGWKSMSSLVNRSMVERRLGRAAGHRSTYALTSVGVLAAEERNAILLSAGAPALQPAGAASAAAAPASPASAPSAAKRRVNKKPSGRPQQRMVIDLADSSDSDDGTSSATSQVSKSTDAEIEIELSSGGDSPLQQSAARLQAPSGQGMAVNLDSSGAISSPDDDSDGLGALLKLRPQRGTNQPAAAVSAAASSSASAAATRTGARGRQARRSSGAAAAAAAESVQLPSTLHPAVRKQWTSSDTLVGQTLLGSGAKHPEMAIFPGLRAVLDAGGKCACPDKCQWRLAEMQLVLIIDAREPASVAGVVTAQCARLGICCVSFALPVGDFTWGLMQPAVVEQMSLQPGTCHTVPKHLTGGIKLLGFITERKGLDDLVNSIVSKGAPLEEGRRSLLDGSLGDSSIAATGGSGAVRSRFLMQHWTLQRCGLRNVSYILEGTAATLKASGHVPAEKIIRTTIAESVIAGLAMISTDSELSSARVLSAQGGALANLLLEASACGKQLVSITSWETHVRGVLARQLSGQKEVFQQQLHQLYRMPSAVAAAVASNHSTPRALRNKLLSLGSSAEQIRYLSKELPIQYPEYHVRPSGRVAALLSSLYA